MTLLTDEHSDPDNPDELHTLIETYTSEQPNGSYNFPNDSDEPIAY